MKEIKLNSDTQLKIMDECLEKAKREFYREFFRLSRSLEDTGILEESNLEKIDVESLKLNDLREALMNFFDISEEESDNIISELRGEIMTFRKMYIREQTGDGKCLLR